MSDETRDGSARGAWRQGTVAPWLLTVTTISLTSVAAASAAIATRMAGTDQARWAYAVVIVAIQMGMCLVTHATGPRPEVDGADLTQERLDAKVRVGMVYAMLELPVLALVGWGAAPEPIVVLILSESAMVWHVTRAVATLTRMRNAYPW